MERLAHRPGLASQEQTESCDSTARPLAREVAGLTDAWGNHLRADAWNRSMRAIPVRSAGPDGQFHTPDDLVYFLPDRSCPEPLYDSGDIIVHFEHDRAPRNGLAEIVGSVSDPTGAAIPRSTIRLIARTSGAVRTTSSHDDGSFHFAGVPAGHYQIQVVSPGFKTAAQ